MPLILRLRLIHQLDKLVSILRHKLKIFMAKKAGIKKNAVKKSAPRKKAAAKKSTPKKKSSNGKKWSNKVTETSNALDLQSDVFKKEDPHKIALSLTHSA